VYAARNGFEDVEDAEVVEDVEAEAVRRSRWKNDVDWGILVINFGIMRYGYYSCYIGTKRLF
jgi:hypothetical protein